MTTADEPEDPRSRIPLHHPRTPLVRLAQWYSRRAYGEVLDPALAVLHNRRVLATALLTEGSVRRWRSLDPTVQGLAVMASASSIGCTWCMDFGYWESSRRGVDGAKPTYLRHG